MDLEKILALTKNLSVLIVEDELALRESFQFLLRTYLPRLTPQKMARKLSTKWMSEITILF